MADSAKQLLVRVPELELAESPSSWLSRTALAQGVPTKELLEYLGFTHKGDVDLAVCRTNLNRLAAICGISNTRFRTVKRMFLGVSKLDRSGTRYLLSNNPGLPTSDWYGKRGQVSGKKLSTFHAEVRDLFDLDLLAPWERPLLLNGRALLAALYQGSFRVSKSEGTFSVGAIRRIERQGLLPHDHFKLDSAEYLRRSRV